MEPLNPYEDDTIDSDDTQTTPRSFEGRRRATMNLRTANENIRKAQGDDALDIPVNPKKTGNRPRFDRRLGRVTEGYGVLQPRVEIALPSAARSWFARVMAGHVGWDPYTTAASDVYQDLFHEGSYVGKGIYDVEAFHRSFPDWVDESAR